MRALGKNDLCNFRIIPNLAQNSLKIHFISGGIVNTKHDLFRAGEPDKINREQLSY